MAAQGDFFALQLYPFWLPSKSWVILKSISLMVAELSVSLYPDSPPTMGLESNTKTNTQFIFSSALVPTKVAKKHLCLAVGIFFFFFFKLEFLQIS